LPAALASRARANRVRIAGQPEEALRAVLVLVDAYTAPGQLAEDQRLAGLDANAGEVEAGSGAGQGRLDQIEFARRNSA
jgi:hypothetical protein